MANGFSARHFRLRRQSASGDGAFERGGVHPNANAVCPFQSGVALRLPPQSRTICAESVSCGAVLGFALQGASWTAPAERSGDGAFACTKTKRICENYRPQSMTRLYAD
jgi:hypothetical protein